MPANKSWKESFGRALFRGKGPIYHFHDGEVLDQNPNRTNSAILV